MSGALSDFVENCQEEAKQHFGLTPMETYLDALQDYKSIPEPTAEDHRCMIYLIFCHDGENEWWNHRE